MLLFRCQFVIYILNLMKRVSLLLNVPIIVLLHIFFESLLVIFAVLFYYYTFQI